MSLIRYFFGPIWLFALAACTGAPLMKMDISEYRAAFSYTSDEQILVNILKARDSAPLHFAELASLGANMQLTSSLQASMPFGELYGATTRASAQGTVGAQNNPTFSLSSLETQNFTAGLFNPVKPALLKQFFDEGIDTRLLLLLFFSGVQENGQVYLNNFKCNYAEERCLDDLFKHYLPGINRLAKERLVGNIYTELTPVGSKIDWQKNIAVKDLAAIDTNKYRVFVLGQSATVYSVSDPKFELCARLGDGKRLVHPISHKPCKDVYYVSPFVSDKTGLKALPVRSVYQVIEYLGQVLEYQEAHAGESRCITLNTDIERKYRCDSNEILFQVNPVGGSAPLVTANYLGVPYTVAVGPCKPKAYCDHSAEVMKIVSLLINVNKSATDIPQVPLVRIAQ